MAAQARRAHLRGDPAARRASWPRWASTRCASPAASRSCAATSPSSSRMLAATPGVEDLSLTTNGVLLDRLAAPAGRGRAAAHQRLARLALAHTLRRDHAPRRARPRAARARRGRAPPRAAADQGQLRRHPRLHRGRGARARRARPRTSPTSCASSSSCRSTPTATGTPTRSSPARRSARSSSAAGRSCRAPGQGVVDRPALPLRRRRRRARLRQPGHASRSAPAATASA